MREEERASKQHRAALEAMFAKGELGKLFADKLGNSGGSGAPDGSRASGAPAAEGGKVVGAPAAPAPSPEQPGRAVAPSPAAKAPPDPNSRTSLRKKVLEAVGRDQVSRAVDKYIELHGMPADFEFLEQALDHQRDERLGEVLSALERTLEKERPKRSRALAGKLRFLEETSDDSELQGRAARIRGKLG